MNNIYDDVEYMNIVSNIMRNDNFLQIKKCVHHGTNRLDHCLRVSYYSYLVTRKLKLNYVETARGGLLHDFFITNEMPEKEQHFRLIVHPYKALNNACENFNISDLEQDIIINHMFPVLPHKIPKYTESWIVSLVDKAVAIYEFYESYAKTYVYKFSRLYFVFLLMR